MSKKKTHEEYVVELAEKNPNVEVIEQYINADTSILHRCVTHDILWKTSPSRALQGVGCESCRIEKFRQVRCKTHQQYVKEVETVNPIIDVVGVYIDATTPIEHYCKKHNLLWNAAPDSILHGHGCIECGKEKISKKNKKGHDEYIDELNNVNPNIEVMEEYIDANTAILHRCKIDNYQWSAKPGNILFGKGCPRCNESHGEKQIRQWLNIHNIEYAAQYIFGDCKNKRPLPFDFYLPEYNVCIEYDGEQHFRPVNFFGGEDGLKQRRYNDSIKTEYCVANNIRLLRIPHYKNIEEELETLLFI